MSEPGEEYERDLKYVGNRLRELLEVYGGAILIKATGLVLQEVADGSNAPVVGKAIEALAEVEW